MFHVIVFIFDIQLLIGTNIIINYVQNANMENTSISFRGNIEERKLGDHDPGTLLASSVRVTSNTAVDGRCSDKMTFEVDNQL